MEVFFYLFVVFFVVIAIGSVVESLMIANKKTNWQKKAFLKKKDLFHETVGEMDKDHKDRVGNILVEHPKAEPGYIVLNGVKRKLEDCKYL